MAINTIILNRIDSLVVPAKMKNVLKDVLEAEEQMRILNDKNYKNNLSKILEKYADDADITEFCRRHGS